MEKQLKSGPFPNSRYQYEEFESILACYYLTYLHLKESDNTKDRENFKKLSEILNAIAEKSSVQTPEEAVKNVRSSSDWCKPEKLPYSSVKDIWGWFFRTFGMTKKSDSYRDVLRLNDLVLSSKMGFEDPQG